VILTDVRRALRERGAATVAELVAELGTERAMVEEALRYWCGRGAAAPAEPSVGGGGAAGCALGCPLCPRGAAAAAPRAVAYRWCAGAAGT
jgi:hypothetical protein